MNNSFMIGKTPAVIYGDMNADKVFIFVHGLCGRKEEAQIFSKTVSPHGYAVLGVDLPEHGERSDGVSLLPWNVVPELQGVMDYAKSRWKHISLRTISIGTWFSLVAFEDEICIEKCLFSSPLLDMEKMIEHLMALEGVSEERLKSEREILSDGGQTLSWKYLCWTREHPVHSLCRDTYLLYASEDETIPPSMIDSFTKKYPCSLTIVEGAKHWLHTDEELEQMAKWELSAIEK